MTSEAFEDTGYHGRYTPEPDGLEHKCEVCKRPAGSRCVNPITNRERHNGISCFGRKERTS